MSLLLDEAREIFRERHGGENMHSRQIAALADAVQKRLEDLENRLTTRIIRSVSSERADLD